MQEAIQITREDFFAREGAVQDVMRVYWVNQPKVKDQLGADVYSRAGYGAGTRYNDGLVWRGAYGRSHIMFWACTLKVRFPKVRLDHTLYR